MPEKSTTVPSTGTREPCSSSKAVLVGTGAEAEVLFSIDGGVVWKRATDARLVDSVLVVWGVLGPLLRKWTHNSDSTRLQRIRRQHRQTEGDLRPQADAEAGMQGS